jgi:hypothetical protein
VSKLDGTKFEAFGLKIESFDDPLSFFSLNFCKISESLWELENVEKVVEF